MGATEEAGKVATGVVSALTGSPALLVLVLLQVATMGVLYFNSANLNAHRHEREMLMLNKCLSDHEKVAVRRTRFSPQMQGPPIPEELK